MPSARLTGSGGPAVTISHQTGAGAHEIAGRLAEILQQSEPEGTQAWTVLDRQVVEQALEEHHWPKRLIEKMPEERRSYLADVLDDFFGLRPPSWVLVPQVIKTTMRLASAGHVVLIGRGATVVTAQLPNVFHVRLMASASTRIGRVQAARHLTAEEAARFIEKADRGRERYIRANFHVHLDDELLYHMVVNTDRLSIGDAAADIADAARRCFRVGPGAGFSKPRG
jgi:cytidylate kinase